ncbi:MAG TPA: hypothetical protein VHZ76_08985, partial [Gammaproteobacteria bacterium]|nr:hypothetical protein [Gammaproteobacteria bacterium]
ARRSLGEGGVADMIAVSLVLSVLSAIFGYIFASYADVSIAGSIASMTGVLFIGTLLYFKKLKTISKYI